MVEFEGENGYAAYSYDELYAMLWNNEPTPLYNAAKQWHGYRHDLADAANFLRRGASKLRTKWRSAGGEAYLTELQRQATVLSDQADLADQNYHALQGAAEAWADTLKYVEKLGGQPRTHDGGPVDPDDPSSDVRQPAFAKAMRKLAKEQAAARENLVYLDVSDLGRKPGGEGPGSSGGGDSDPGPSDGSRGGGSGAAPTVKSLGSPGGFAPATGAPPASVRPGGTGPRPGVGGVPGKPATRSPAASGGRTSGVIDGR
ncbi:MAG: PPE domain-containing protein, partial [Micromonosporaceae bacterium]